MRRLSIAGATTHTDGHHVTVNGVGIDLQVHLVVEAMKGHHHNRSKEGQGTRTQQRTGLTALVHNVGNETDVDTVQEIAPGIVACLILITHTAQIDLTYTVLYQPINGLLNLALLEVPITGKVVKHAIGNDAQGNCLAHLGTNLHQAVHGIAQCRIATHQDDGLIAVVDEHAHQTLHAVTRFTLHKVILHLAQVKCSLHLLPALAVSSYAFLRAVEYAPTIVSHIYNLTIYNLQFILSFQGFSPLSPPSAAWRQSSEW